MKFFFNKVYGKIAAYFCLLMGVIAPLKSWSDQTDLRDKNSEIFVAAKAFDRVDCQKYLDRNLLLRGYQPIQIIIKNHTDRAIVFSPNDMEISCISVEDVIKDSEESVYEILLDVAPYGNSRLAADYRYKAAKEQTIQPNSMLNKLIFVPKGNCPSSFKITLHERGSNQIYEADVLVKKMKVFCIHN